MKQSITNIQTLAKQRGITLLEIIIVVAIMAIMLVFALPAYKDMMAKNRLKNAANEFRASFYLAQTTALDEKTSVVICASADGQTCASNADFSQGWIVAKFDGNATTGITPTLVVQDVPQDPKKVKVAYTGGATSSVIFNRKGELDSLKGKRDSNMRFTDAQTDSSGQPLYQGSVTLAIARTGSIKTDLKD